MGHIIFIFIPIMYKLILGILAIDKKYLIIFPNIVKLHIIFYKARFVYYLVINN